MPAYRGRPISRSRRSDGLVEFIACETYTFGLCRATVGAGWCQKSMIYGRLNTIYSDLFSQRAGGSGEGRGGLDCPSNNVSMRSAGITVESVEFRFFLSAMLESI